MSSRIQKKAQAREARLAAEHAAEQAALRRRRLTMLGGVLAAAVLILGAAVFVSQSGETPTTEPDTRMALLEGVPQDGTRLGSADAPVVVEEYADMQCPFCGQFATDELPAIIRDYVRPGRVRLEFRVLTFLGPDSMRAGRFVTAAAAQDRLWHVSEAFFADQGTENSGYVTQDFLRSVGEQTPGLDVDRAFADQATPEVREGLRDAQAAATRAGVQSTPTFVVRGRDGDPQVVSSEGLRPAIDAALQQ